MNTNVINVTVILSVIVGTYFIATALFHWSFAKYFDCPVRLLGLKHSETLPYVLVLMLFFGVATLFEMDININSRMDFMEFLMTEFCSMLISWILFFRAWFDFKRLSVSVFLRILLGVLLIAFVSGLPMGESWKDMRWITAGLRTTSEMLVDSGSQTTKSAEMLRDLAKEKMNPSPGFVTLPTWGDGSEKDLLEIYNWSREEEKRLLGYVRDMGVLPITIYLGVLLVWVIPMSVTAGRLFALPGVRKYETVEFLRDRQEQCQYLVAIGEQWIVLRDKLSYPFNLEVIMTKDVSFRILPTDKLPLSLQLKNMGSALFCVWRDYRWEGR